MLTTALLCMSLNVYHEARGESVEGQFAVAQVTMNRAGTPDRVCEEVIKPKQFSWTENLIQKKRLTKQGLPKDKNAWDRAVVISRIILSQRLVNTLPNVHYFHNPKKSQPSWAKSMTLFADIGSHRFYRESKHEKTIRFDGRSSSSQLVSVLAD
jgi:N-acetylmuramoyl-L-alanine amidase